MEIDYEKEYKEALERAKHLRDSKYQTMNAKRVVEEIFPQLAESEDEKVRKALIQYLKDYPGNLPNGLYSRDDFFTYLEKQEEQEEQKAAEWSEFDKGVLGDAICAADILGNDESFNKGNPNLGKAFRIAKDWLKSLPERFNPLPKPEWSEEDRDMLNSILLHFNAPFYNMDETERLWFNWLQSLPERFNLQPKQEWGEEDEANLDYLIDFCNSYYNGNTRTLTESIARTLSNWLYRVKSGEISLPKSRLDEKDEKTIHLACEFIRHHATKNDSIGGIDCSELVERLKSLRPQIIDSAPLYTIEKVDEKIREAQEWKPSEEQMAALNALNCHGDLSYVGQQNQLISLYNDLKKLM